MAKIISNIIFIPKEKQNKRNRWSATGDPAKPKNGGRAAQSTATVKRKIDFPIYLSLLKNDISIQNWLIAQL